LGAKVQKKTVTADFLFMKQQKMWTLLLKCYNFLLLKKSKLHEKVWFSGKKL